MESLALEELLVDFAPALVSLQFRSWLLVWLDLPTDENLACQFDHDVVVIFLHEYHLLLMEVAVV